MKRLALVVLLFAVTVVGLAAPPSGSGAPTAAPRLSAAAPYGRAFRGSGFVAYERVTVTGVVGATRLRALTRADARGRFLVTVRSRPGRCGEVAVRAVGDRGSRAALTLSRPACREP